MLEADIWKGDAARKDLAVADASLNASANLATGCVCRGRGTRIVAIIAQQQAGAGEVPEDRIAMIWRQAAVDRRWAPVGLAGWPGYRQAGRGAVYAGELRSCSACLPWRLDPCGLVQVCADVHPI